MTDPIPAEPPPATWPPLRWRRYLWLFYAFAWTVALLAPVPLHARNPEEEKALFTFSKLLHIAAFSLFTILAAWMRLPPRPRALVFVFLVAHTMLSELGQYLLRDITHRTGQWSDVGLDCIGIAVGFVLTYRWWLK